MGFRAAASATMALAALVAAQTSPPTVMTTRILRGPDWSRPRSAMPDIIVGRNQRVRGQEPVSWTAAAPLAPATRIETLNLEQRLFVRSVEAASTQVIPKPPRLQPHGKRNRRGGQAAGGQRIIAYHAPFAVGPVELRKAFEFARRLKAAALGSSPPPQSLPVLETVTNESGVNVAVENRSRSEAPVFADPKSFLAALQRRSKRIGACANTANWLEAGVNPVQTFQVLKDHVIADHLSDRSALGKRGHAVPLGRRVAGVSRFLEARYRAGGLPLFLTTESSRSGDPLPDLTKSFDARDKALQPLAGVLLSFDAQRTDIRRKPDCDICDRADNDIAVSWIRSYGKGRIFYTTVRHLPALFAAPLMPAFSGGPPVRAGRLGRPFDSQRQAERT